MTNTVDTTETSVEFEERIVDTIRRQMDLRKSESKVVWVLKD